MSVLIENMEMPKDCVHCRFNNASGLIIALCDLIGWVKMKDGSRADECPLAEPCNDAIWNALSEVYNMDGVPDEAKSIIGDVMLGLGEQPEPVWHECFDDDPASFPDDERNVLVSFSNFSLSIIGQWRVDESGAGCWYLGDTDETFLSEDLYVDGWWELPKKPEGREQ